MSQIKKSGLPPRPIADPLSELCRLLGAVVFLRCVKADKMPIGKWKHLTVADMTPQYLANLKGFNVGVALGEVSGGLCVIDFDNDSFVESFLALNPALANSFRTHGARGCGIWFRLIGKCPASCKLKTESGDDVGEVRSNGNQSIAWGTHPATKKAYQWLVRQPVVQVQFNSIQWPDGIRRPECIEGRDGQEEQEAPEESRGAVGHSGSSSASGTSLSSSPSDPSDSSSSSIHEGWSTQIRGIEDVLRRCVPTKEHTNNRLLFDLARGVKALELLQDNVPFSPEQLLDLFEQWHARSKRFLRSEQSKEDYWIEFLSACTSAKYALGGVAVMKAWENAQSNPLPPEAEKFENKDFRLVIALCRELQKVNGDKPFYLSSYTAQQLLGHKSHTTVAKWLKSLRALRIIELVEQGNTHRASRYRYVAGAETSVEKPA